MPSPKSLAAQSKSISFSCSVPPSHEFVVDASQPLAQMKHCIAFARKQRVHAHTGRRGHLLEAASLHLVRKKYLPLLLRQLVNGQLKLIEKHAANVQCFRSGI